jgi:CheY-like chemotaxis protein
MVLIGRAGLRRDPWRELAAQVPFVIESIASLARGRLARVARILVVDDEPDQRSLLRRIFERAGHDVADAVNGAAALAAVQASAPDLVVTDIMMPVMGGAELIRRLRAEPATAHIPILAATGDARFAGAADAVMPKPYVREHLVALAESLLREGRVLG